MSIYIYTGRSNELDHNQQSNNPNPFQAVKVKLDCNGHFILPEFRFMLNGVKQKFHPCNFREATFTEKIIFKLLKNEQDKVA